MPSRACFGALAETINRVIRSDRIVLAGEGADPELPRRLRSPTLNR